MSEVVTISVDDIVPDVDTILRAQGIGAGETIDQRIRRAAENALRIFADISEPASIVEEITADVFAPIYRGLGRNADPAPIDDIYREADYFMLFAATVGHPVSDKIRELFAANEFVLGNALDVTASEATDRISHVLEKRFAQILASRIGSDADRIVLAYSPGYCGWHISAQKVLFEALHPGTIGITLRESFLMEPLKSISGVLIAGNRNVHRIDNSYVFCADCRSQPCRARMELSEDKKN